MSALFAETSQRADELDDANCVLARRTKKKAASALR